MSPRLPLLSSCVSRALPAPVTLARNTLLCLAAAAAGEVASQSDADVVLVDVDVEPRHEFLAVALADMEPPTLAEQEAIASGLLHRDASIRLNRVAKLLALRPDLLSMEDSLTGLAAFSGPIRGRGGCCGGCVGLATAADVELLGDPDPEIRCEAIRVVCQTPSVACANEDALLACCTAADECIRSAIARFLPAACWNRRVERAMAGLVVDSSVDVRLAVISGVGFREQERGAMDILRCASRDPDPEVRVRALSALGGFGALAEPACEDVLASMRDEHHDVRRMAMFVAVRWQVCAPRATQALHAFFVDRLPEEQLEILDRLIHARFSFGAKIPGLVQLTEHPDAEIRGRALLALLVTAPPGAAALRAVEMLQDLDPRVRRVARDLLRRRLELL